MDSEEVKARIRGPLVGHDTSDVGGAGALGREDLDVPTTALAQHGVMRVEEPVEAAAADDAFADPLRQRERQVDLPASEDPLQNETT